MFITWFFWLYLLSKYVIAYSQKIDNVISKSKQKRIYYNMFQKNVY
jgi:hypothetical protein